MGGVGCQSLSRGEGGECYPVAGTIGQVFCKGNCASMRAGVQGDGGFEGLSKGVA